METRIGRVEAAATRLRLALEREITEGQGTPEVEGQVALTSAS